MLGWITLMLFCLSFMALPIATLLLIPYVWRTFPWLAGTYLFSIIISYLLPLREWIWFRKIGQLWYEIFNFQVNVHPAQMTELASKAIKEKFIIAMVRKNEFLFD
jgi:hypothetical protein